MQSKLTRVPTLAGIVLLFCLSANVLAQSDPLNAAYKPSIDCTTSDYPNFSFVQMTPPLVKLRQDEAFSDLSTQGNAPCLTIMLTQNEFQGFWIHVAGGGGAGGVTNLNVLWSTVPAKTTGPGGNASFCAVAKDCLIYSVFYNQVTSTTNLSCNTENSCSASNSHLYEVLGGYPDQLIPKVDPYRNQTTNAFPINVAANKNQSVWVDTHVPKTAPSGWYLGQIQVTGNGGTLATMPVLFGVWQWPASQGGFMPSTSSIQNHYDMTESGTGAFCNKVYGGSGFNNCTSYPSGLNANVADGMVLGLDHRISFDPHEGDQLIPVSGVGDFSGFDTWYGPMFDGTTANLTGILNGPKLTARTLLCASDLDDATCITEWVNHFTTKGWLPTLIFYPCDEPPGGCSFAAIVTFANTLHGATTKVPMFVTTNIFDSTTAATNVTDTFQSELFNMDVPCAMPYSCFPAGTNQRSAYNTWLMGTSCVGCPARRLGMYVDNLQSGGTDFGTWPWIIGSPNYAIDGLPVANRALQWLQYFNTTTFDLYYSVDVGFTTGDPWAMSGLFKPGINSLGDGTLVYPCSASMTQGHYCGVTTPIWIPSLRLKFIRDGFQDYEYLNVLNAMGQGSFVTTEIAKWLNGIHSFNLNPNAATGSFTSTLPAVRLDLGNQMHALTFFGAGGAGTTIAPAPMMLVKQIRKDTTECGNCK